MPSNYQRRVAALTDKLQKDPGLPVPNPTTSYWQCPPNKAVSHLQSQSLVSETDILIIGSGISGCSVARQLLQNDPTLRVTILEARTTTSGATGRNGGHIKAIPEHAHEDLRPVLSLEETREVMRFWVENVQALLALNETLSPEMKAYGEVRPVKSLEVFTNLEALEHFKKVVEAFERDDEVLRGRGKFETAEDVQKAYGFTTAAGGYLHPAGAAWPYRLITGLFTEMLQTYKDRFTIETQTPVESITALPNGTYKVTTPRGTITTKQIVHATNGHAGHLNPGLRGNLFPVRGQMTAQTPTSHFGKQGGNRSWGLHYGTGYDYMTQSGRTGEIFLGGGLGQAEDRGLSEIGNTNDSVNATLSLAHLGGILNSISGHEKPIQQNIKQAWTGVMGFTGDSLPLIGKLPRKATLRAGEGEWITAGFNGWGMSNTWLCGKHIADRILGRKDGQKVPSKYVITEERLGKMGAVDGAKIWMNFFGLGEDEVVDMSKAAKL